MSSEHSEQTKLYFIPQGSIGRFYNDQSVALITTSITTCVGVILSDDSGRIALAHADAANISNNFFPQALKGFPDPANVTIRLFGTESHPVFNAFKALAETSPKKELKTDDLTNKRNLQDSIMVKRTMLPNNMFDIKFMKGSEEDLLGRRNEEANFYIKFGPLNTGRVEEYYRGMNTRCINVGLCPNEELDNITGLKETLYNGIWGKPEQLKPYATRILGTDWQEVEKNTLAGKIAEKVIEMLGNDGNALQVTENVWNAALALREHNKVIEQAVAIER